MCICFMGDTGICAYIKNGEKLKIGAHWVFSLNRNKNYQKIKKKLENVRCGS